MIVSPASTIPYDSIGAVESPARSSMSVEWTVPSRTSSTHGMTTYAQAPPYPTSNRPDCHRPDDWGPYEHPNTRPSPPPIAAIHDSPALSQTSEQVASSSRSVSYAFPSIAHRPPLTRLRHRSPPTTQTLYTRTVLRCTKRTCRPTTATPPIRPCRCRRAALRVRTMHRR